jgi:sugar phosphate permease
MHGVFSMLEALFASGRIVDIAVALMLAETAAIWLYRRARGRPVALADLAWNVVAGASLLLALRAALTDAGWMWIAGFLTAALIAHIGDTRRRLTVR